MNPSPAPTGLIISADDFGLATKVNDAVEQAYVEGVLTAASLMVTGAAVADAVSRARHLSGLAVGLHLVLVEGRPALPAADIPHLVDQSGRFLTNMVAAGATMFFNPAARRELEAEITAQFQRFAETGLRLDHVNAHKHFHLHPTIAGLILKIGARFGLNAVRMPMEPRAVLRQVEPGAYPAAPVIDLWANLARNRVRRAGLIAPDHVFGLRWSGAMTPSRLTGLIDALPPGLSEIYMHPATGSDFPGAAPGYGYADELAALLGPSAKAAILAQGVRTGGFADFIAR